MMVTVMSLPVTRVSYFTAPGTGLNATNCRMNKPVPLYAITASARQRLPKVRACIEFWVEWIARQQNPDVTAV